MSPLRKWLGAAAIFALLFAYYLPSLQGEFLWDDDSNVSDNPTLRALDGLVAIWASPFANQQFYPLTHSSFWIEYQLWELWPTGFRITNLLLHGLVALLLWTALCRLRVPGAWVAAAVFALHPVHVESVAWITERKNLLSAVFYFAALLFYLRFAGLDGHGEIDHRVRRRAYALSLVFFACMLLSKTAFLTLPAGLLVIVWWKRGRIARADLLPTLPLFAMATLFGLITAWLERQHVGAGGAAWELNIVERLIVAGRVLWFYAGKLVLPLGLNFIYPRWTIDSGALWQYAFPVAAVALVVLLCRHRERLGRGPLAAVLLFGVTLAPALGLIDFYFQIYSYVQDHFQYLASAALIALLVGAAVTGLARLHPRAPAVAAALLLLALGGLTRARSREFTSREVLWTGVLERNPGAWMADINLGLLYEEQGRLTDAAERFEHALAANGPEQDKAHYNLGRVLQTLGRVDEAREQFDLALAHNPDNANALNNLGNLLVAEEDTEGAIELYRRALAAEPRHSRAHYNLALALASHNLAIEAEQHFRAAVRSDPGYADAHDGLGRLLNLQGRFDEALESYKRALGIDAARPVIFYNMGLIHDRRGDRDSAEAHYRAALRLDPDLAEAHNNLAIVLFHKRRYDEAWKEVHAYERLGGVPHPDFVKALSEASR